MEERMRRKIETFVDKSIEISLDQNLVFRHKTPISILELFVGNHSINPPWYIGAHIHNSYDKFQSNRRAAVIESFESEEEAKKRYDELLEKIQDGKYELHIYEDGTFEVKIT